MAIKIFSNNNAGVEYLLQAAGCYRPIPFMSPYPEFEKVVSTVEDMFATLVYNSWLYPAALWHHSCAADWCFANQRVHVMHQRV